MFYAFKGDGSRLSELDFLMGLPDPLRFERVKEYTAVVSASQWGPEGEAEAPGTGEEDVRVTAYRVFGADHNVLWAFFWRKQTELEGWEEDGVLHHLERNGQNHVKAILTRLAEGFALRVRDELGFELGSEEFRGLNP
jgi:hypothetical protein